MCPRFFFSSLDFSLFYIRSISLKLALCFYLLFSLFPSVTLHISAFFLFIPYRQVRKRERKLELIRWKRLLSVSYLIHLSVGAISHQLNQLKDASRILEKKTQQDQ